MAEDIKSFEKRVKRIAQTEKGGFFSAKRRQADGRKPLRLPVFNLLLCACLVYGGLTVAKIYLEREMGKPGYTAHLAGLAEGSESARIAAKLLKRDRFMSFVEERI